MGAIARLREHPRGFWFVFWGELAERASYYGMRTILALYLLDVLAYDKSSGASIVQFFMAAAYFTPLLGGYLADRWLGRYRTILYFSIPYVVGHLVLGGVPTRWAMFTALGLLALGAGSIKPNISTLLGQIYDHEKKQALMTEGFSYYYAAINIGAVLTTFTLPWVRIRWGYGPALMVPAILMAVAFAVFAAGKGYYPREEVRKRPKKTPEQRAAEWATLRRLGGVFALIAVFWFVYDQNATTWMYFARDHLDLTLVPSFWIVPEVSLTADQLQSVNPFFIVILTPLFNALWQMLRKRRGGRPVADTRKMLVGFGIVVVCAGIMSLAGFVAGDGRVSVWFEVVAIFVMTLAELCVSVVGLEFAYTQAMPGTKSTVTAVFWLTVTAGDFAGGFFDHLYDDQLSPGSYFAVQAGIVFLAALVLVRVARGFHEDADAAIEPALPASG